MEKGLEAHFTEDFGQPEIMHPIITSIKQQRLGF
jgi:hypothetical protein